MMKKIAIFTVALLLLLLLVPANQAKAQLSSLSTGANPFTNALGPNGIVYTAAYTCSCVKIHDFSDKFNPVTRATISTDLNPDFIVATGTYAYVGASGKLDVFDMSSSTSPSQVFTYTLPGTSNKMRIVGQNLFINYSGNPGGILILSLANPAHPTLVSQTNFTNNPSGVGDVLPIGNFMYVADYFAKQLKVYDISNLSSPVLRQSLPARNENALSYKQNQFEPWRLTSKNNTLYVLDDDILEIYDISSSTNMVYVKSMVTAEDTEGADVSGSYFYFAGSGVGGAQWKVIQIYNIASTTNPTLATSSNTGRNNYWVSIDSNGFYYVNAAAEALVSVYPPYNGVAVSPSSVPLTENTQGSFVVQLGSQPASNVTLTLATTTPGTGVGANVSTSSIIFTTSNWSTPRTVTVTALNDSVYSGSRTVNVHFTSSSADSSFNNLTISDEPILISDDEALPGVNTGTTSIEMSENTQNVFSVNLLTQPTSNVTLVLATSTPGAGAGASVSTTSIVFTPSNYSTPVSVTVSAVDDHSRNGDQTVNIHFTSSSADPGYNGLSVSDIPVLIHDNDLDPGVDISTTDLEMTENTEVTFDIHLLSQPTNDVTVNILTPAPDGGPGVTASPSSVVFTAVNWNDTVSVTLSAINDNVREDDRFPSVNFAVSSADQDYDNFGVISISIHIADDDPLPPTVEVEPYIFNSSNPLLIGNLTNTGGQPSSERGFVYGATANYGATSTEHGIFPIGSFKAALPLIAPGTTIHFAAYAMNSGGISYSGDQSFTTTDPTIVISAPAANQNVSTWAPSVSWQNSGAGYTSCQYSIGKQTDWQSSNDWDGSYTFDGSSNDWSPDNNWGTTTNDWTGGSPSADSWVDVDCGSNGSEIPAPSTFDTWTLAIRGTTDHAYAVALASFNYGLPSESTPPVTTGSSGGSSGGGRSWIRQLLSYLLPTGATTTPAVVPNCPVGYTCAPKPLPIVVPVVTKTFARNLTLNSSGNDVKNLQMYLNAKGFIIASTGPGSPGHETNLFGALTRAALIKYQKANKISPAVGFFGPVTRAFLTKHP